MSGYAHRDVVQKIAQRAAIHIQKPFTIDVLLSRIAEALQTEESEQTGALPRLAV
jgi:DNA-binding NtrC family response regulator